MPLYQVKRKGPEAYHPIEADTLDAAVDKLMGQRSARTGPAGKEIAFAREVTTSTTAKTVSFYRAGG